MHLVIIQTYQVWKPGINIYSLYIYIYIYTYIYIYIYYANIIYLMQCIG